MAQLAFQLTNLLNPRGFVMETRSQAGVVLRRPPRGLFYAGIALAVVGVLSAFGGEPSGLVLTAVGLPMIWLRRPTTIAVDLTPEGVWTRVQPRGPDENGVWEAVERSI